MLLCSQQPLRMGDKTQSRKIKPKPWGEFGEDLQDHVSLAFPSVSLQTFEGFVSLNLKTHGRNAVGLGRGRN